MLTIVAAMEEELAGVRRVLEEKRYPDVELQVAGIGRDGVEKSLRGVLPTPKRQRAGATPPEEMLMLGFAGGVDPSLAAGDLVLAGRYCRLIPGPMVLTYDPDVTGLDRRRPPPELLERLRTGFALGLVQPGYVSLSSVGWVDPVIPDRYELKSLGPDAVMRERARASLADAGMAGDETDSITVERVVTRKSEKRELYRQFGVGTVNMEDYWVARMAQTARVPFLSVRAVLDTGGQRLPSYLARLSNKPGGVAAWKAATHPWDAPTLVRLARQMRAARESLTRFAVAYLERRSAELGGGQLFVP